MKLENNIYYLNEEIFSLLQTRFKLIAKANWYELYQSEDEDIYYRLDAPDKYPQQYVTRINDVDNWMNFDDSLLQKELLKSTRGLSTNICRWVHCEKTALNDSAFCEVHAYEMGVRK